MSDITTRVLVGADLDAVLDDVAGLRMEVFRDWPYIYAGELAHEREYIETYRGKEGAVVVGAFDGGVLIGAATGTRISDHATEFGAPFSACDWPIEDVFYCAESVLLPHYRGRGLGHAFFDAREAHARAIGARYAAFCSVIRPVDHPLRPAAYRPLDGFWAKRGYAPMEGVVARFTWADVGEASPSEKALQFWGRSL
jgi:GNAT superfamily N-acetyltransferase